MDQLLELAAHFFKAGPEALLDLEARSVQRAVEVRVLGLHHLAEIGFDQGDTMQERGFQICDAADELNFVGGEFVLPLLASLGPVCANVIELPEDSTSEFDLLADVPVEQASDDPLENLDQAIDCARRTGVEGPDGSHLGAGDRHRIGERRPLRRTGGTPTADPFADLAKCLRQLFPLQSVLLIIAVHTSCSSSP